MYIVIIVISACFFIFVGQELPVGCLVPSVNLSTSLVVSVFRIKSVR